MIHQKWAVLHTIGFGQSKFVDPFGPYSFTTQVDDGTWMIYGEHLMSKKGLNIYRTCVDICFL